MTWVWSRDGTISINVAEMFAVDLFEKGARE
jgi:hypothetical protein